MSESIQKNLLRVRPPRVKITYDVETGDAIVKRELPFIVGIFADLGGDVAEDKVTAFKDRRIKNIDRDNFNDIMRSIGPRANLGPILKDPSLLELRASGDSDDTQLIFNSLDDFDPLRVVLALPTLAAKYRARSQIRGLQSKAECSDALTHYLDTWVGAVPSKDVDALQTELRKSLSGDFAAGVKKEDLRYGLFALKDKISGYSTAKSNVLSPDDLALAIKNSKANSDALSKVAKTAQDAAAAAPTDTALATRAADAKKAADDAAANPPTDGKSALNTATTMLVTEMKKWMLLAKSNYDPTLPADIAEIEAGIPYAELLAGALSDTDTQENRGRVNAVIAALSDQSTKSDTSSPEDIKRYALRDRCQVQLGKSNAVNMLTALGTLDLNADYDDASWDRAMLLLGLTELDDTQALDKSSYADPKDYQAAYTLTDARSHVLSYAAYLHDTSNAARSSVVDNVFPVLELARTGTTGTATGVALQRLSSLAEQVLANLQAKDKHLLRAMSKGAMAIIDEQVALIDQYLSQALSSIMHSSSFKTAEQTWRGLAYLVMNTETNELLKLRVLNVSKDELRKDMEKAIEFDQSTLFKMIYEAEYDTLGGNPYSLLVGAYEIGAKNDDIQFLKKISTVAAAAHAPFIAAASSEMFGLPSYSTLDKPRDLAKIFEAEELEGWREFRDMEDARYVSLVLPRALMRLPYGDPVKRNTQQCEGLNFEEQLSSSNPQIRYNANGDAISYSAPDTSNFVFGNAAFLLAQRITHAFSLYSWTAAIRGVEGGGLVEGLPIYTYVSDSGTTEILCPTEVAITDRREKELNDLGFISLCHHKGSGKAVFFGGQTTNQPKKYFSDSANANARISAMLPYMLAASRFAHYIKVIMRDKIGSFQTRANIENFLNSWIANYVLLDDNASQEIKAAYPLRAASVVVTEVPGQPGVFRATAFLKPHFQLEELTTSIRLVAELPS